MIATTMKSLSSVSADDDDSDSLEMQSADCGGDFGVSGPSSPGSSYNLPHIQCVDVCSEKKMAFWIMDILEEFGIPDIVINNSTVIGDDNAAAGGLSYDDFVQISDSNVMAYFHLLKYVLPSMIKRKRGVVINMTGTAQSVPSVFKTAYNASKFATEGYVESLSEQLFRAEHVNKQQNEQLTAR